MRRTDFSPPSFGDDAAPKLGGKRPRAEFEESQICCGIPKATIRYVRVKEVGTRLKNQIEQRNKRILEIAAPLPEQSRLTARAVYWFVSTEELEIMFEDATLFNWKEKVEVTSDDGTVHYLYQVDFAKNRQGAIAFKLSNGEVVTIFCCTKNLSTSRKRAKISQQPSPADNKFNNMDLNYESQSAEHSDQVLMDGGARSNSGQSLPADPVLDFDADCGHWLYSPDSAQYIRAPPQVLHDGTQLSATDALIVNVLVLVPDTLAYIELIETALIEIGFVKEVSSDGQHLFSEKELLKKKLHVLVFPYGKMNRYIKIQDRVHFASEVLLVLESGPGQPHGLAAVERVMHINGTVDTWQFAVKKTNLSSVEVDYTTLNKAAQLLFSIDELRQAVLGGLSHTLTTATPPLSEFLLQWNLGPCARHVVQNIYLCFTYEPTTIRPFSEYAAITLAALGIDCEAFVSRGSVHVILRCPSHVMWHVMVRQDEIFSALMKEGLTAVHESRIWDVESALQRPNNEEFVAELSYLLELMISDEAKYLPNMQRGLLPLREDNYRHAIYLIPEVVDPWDTLQSTEKTTAKRRIYDELPAEGEIIFSGTAEEMKQFLAMLGTTVGTPIELQKGARYHVVNDEALKKELLRVHESLQTGDQSTKKVSDCVNMFAPLGCEIDRKVFAVKQWLAYTHHKDNVGKALLALPYDPKQLCPNYENCTKTHDLAHRDEYYHV